MKAADNGHVRAVQTLIRAKCNLDGMDQNGNTALMYAVRDDFGPYIRCVELLIRGRADISIQNDNNETALSIAREYQNIEAIALLEYNKID
jgi:ankyrin repeat protein